MEKIKERIWSERRQIKENHMKELAQYKKQLWKEPQLRNLFLEMTLRCNESCIHCGSNCGEIESRELSKKQYISFLDEIAVDFGTRGIMLCITGGEPLLRKDLFEIMSYAKSLGFHWGMTSNGTLIDQQAAEDLFQSGMSTISISIDGLEETHDAFRGRKGAYQQGVRGINELILHGGFNHIQVTTVVHKKNINELEEMYNIFKEMKIDSWRVVGIEPIGRARERTDYLLDIKEIQRLMQFIKEKRQIGMPVMYGCSHYLGFEYEREVRDWYFICNAGIYTASIHANGDIGACIDIESNEQTIQGNILNDHFKDVWENKFQFFRRNLYEENENCNRCQERERCGGDAYHSWDYTNNKPLVCMKGILFE